MFLAPLKAISVAERHLKCFKSCFFAVHRMFTSRYVIYLQLEKEIKELTKQRDLAQSRVEDLLKMNENDQHSSNMVCIISFYRMNS